MYIQIKSSLDPITNITYVKSFGTQNSLSYKEDMHKEEKKYLREEIQNLKEEIKKLNDYISGEEKC